MPASKRRLRVAATNPDGSADWEVLNERGRIVSSYHAEPGSSVETWWAWARKAGINR